MTVDLPDQILQYLASHNSVNSASLAKTFNEDHQKIVGAIKSLQSAGNVVETTQKAEKVFKLTSEGEEVVQNGSHEARVYKAITEEGLLQSALMNSFPHAKVGFSKAMSLGWVCVDKKAAGGPRVTRKLESIIDSVQEDLKRLMNGGGDTLTDAVKQELKKRKLLQEITLTTYDVKKGSEFTTCIEKPETDLTPEMIASGSWKNKTFKDYNFDALGIPPSRGHLHPLMKVRTEFRQIFLEMGFTEMPTNNFVESSFWCFDALFVPQQHPARDEQDTFFVSDPATSEDLPMDYLEAVKRVHSEGDYGSSGYNYQWKIEEAKKNVLRTHTTAVSARMLTALGKEKTFRPVKWFSIDRVFRNETLDATHLAEFQQIEGVVADYGITLGAHMGIIAEFFKKLGIDQIRFKPTFNPYTEPSMEVFGYHEGLKKWVEVGNSGVFRPEMIRPMGIPEGVQVLGWGLSLERPTMIKYGIKNIRDLVGHKVNLQMVHEHPVVRLDKIEGPTTNSQSQQKTDSISESSLGEAFQSLRERQEKIIHDVLNLSRQVGELLTQKNTTSPQTQVTPDCVCLVVAANPVRPPFGVALLCSLLNASCMTHIHSSIQDVPPHLKTFLQTSSPFSREPNSKVTLIWKDDGMEPKIVVEPLSQGALEGEANVLRYMGRILEATTNPPSSLCWYERKGPERASLVDQLLDSVHENLLNGSKKQQSAELSKIEARLKRHKWLVEAAEASLADVFLWSTLKKLKPDSGGQSIQRWQRDLRQSLGKFYEGF